MITQNSNGLIGVVGVCASGKSTLIKGLSAYGYRCRHIAQEHSYVQDMWQRLTQPDILIFLHVSFEETKRRKPLNWTIEEYQAQITRLQHANQHANIHIKTDNLTPEDLLEQALLKIEKFVDKPSVN